MWQLDIYFTLKCIPVFRWHSRWKKLAEQSKSLKWKSLTVFSTSRRSGVTAVRPKWRKMWQTTRWPCCMEACWNTWLRELPTYSFLFFNSIHSDLLHTLLCFVDCVILVKNIRRTLTNSGGTIKLTRSSKIKFSSQRRTWRGKPSESEQKGTLKLNSNIYRYFYFLFFRFKDEVATVLETFVEEEDDFIKQVIQHTSVFKWSVRSHILVENPLEWFTLGITSPCNDLTRWRFSHAFVFCPQQAAVIRAQEKHRQEVFESLLEVCFPAMQWQYPQRLPQVCVSIFFQYVHKNTFFFFKEKLNNNNLVLMLDPNDQNLVSKSTKFLCHWVFLNMSAFSLPANLWVKAPIFVLLWS